MACLGTEGLFVKTSERLQGSPLQPQAKLSPQSRTRAYRGAPLVLPPAPPPSRSWLPGSPISAVLCRLLGIHGDEMPFSLVPLFLRMARREPRLSAPLRPFTGATLVCLPQKPPAPSIFLLLHGEALRGCAESPLLPQRARVPVAPPPQAGPALGTPSPPPLETRPWPHAASPPVHPPPCLRSLPCPAQHPARWPPPWAGLSFQPRPGLCGLPRVSRRGSREYRCGSCNPGTPSGPACSPCCRKRYRHRRL